MQYMTLFQRMGLAGLLALMVAVFGQTALTLDDRWGTRGEAYSHGYVLLLLCLYLLYRVRQRIWSAPVGRAWWALPLLAAASMVWLAGHLTETRILQQAILPVLPLAVIAAYCGPAMARAAAFPFLLLYTVMPLWDVLVPPLQYVTVAVCEALLHWVDIPTHIQDTYIHIPAGTLHVAEGCAGLSYLLIGATLAAMQAHLHCHRMTRQLAVLALGVFTGLLCNWIRVFTLVVIAEESNMRSPIIADHEMLGWVVFALLLLPFFMISRRLEDNSPPTQSAPTSQPAMLPASRWVLTGLLLVSGPALAYWAMQWPATSPHQALPATLAGQPLGAPGLAWQPGFTGAEPVLHGGYGPRDAGVDLHVYVYPRQVQGKELAYYSNTIAEGRHWRALVDKAHPSAAPTREAVLSDRGGRTLLVHYWYNIGRWRTTSLLEAKALQLLAFLEGRQDATLVALASPCQSSMQCEQARERLNAFSAALPAELGNH